MITINTVKCQKKCGSHRQQFIPGRSGSPYITVSLELCKLTGENVGGRVFHMENFHKCVEVEKVGYL